MCIKMLNKFLVHKRDDAFTFAVIRRAAPAVNSCTVLTRGQPPPRAHAHEPSATTPAAGRDSGLRVCSHLAPKWRHMELLEG